MLAGGRLREVVTFQRATSTANDYNEPVETWVDHYTCRAEVRYGTGQERRQAAQEQSSQPASFVVRRNPTTDALTVRDRIMFNGETWDIVSLAPAWACATEITAVRAS